MVMSANTKWFVSFPFCKKVDSAQLTELIVVLGREQAGPKLGQHVGGVLEPIHQLPAILHRQKKNV